MTMTNPWGNEPITDNTAGTVVTVDLTDVEEWGEGYDNSPVPSGVYPVLIERVSKDTSKNGTQYLSVMYRITDGEYKKRCLFDRFFVWSPNNKVAKERLRGLLKAAGLTYNVTSFMLEDLLQREFMCTVKLQTKKAEYAAYEGETENVINGYKAISGGKKASAPKAPTPAPSAPKAAPSPAPSAAPAPAQATPSEQSVQPWD